MSREWNQENIQLLLDRSDKAVGRALVALLGMQTSTERMAHQTRDWNEEGFNAFDAEIFTSFAEFYERHGYLTSRQLEVCRKPCRRGSKTTKIGKYGKQLARIANENVDRGKAPLPPPPETHRDLLEDAELD